MNPGSGGSCPPGDHVREFAIWFPKFVSPPIVVVTPFSAEPLARPLAVFSTAFFFPDNQDYTFFTASAQTVDSIPNLHSY